MSSASSAVNGQEVTIDFNGKKLRRSEYDGVVKDITRYIKERLKIEQSAAAFGSL